MDRFSLLWDLLSKARIPSHPKPKPRSINLLMLYSIDLWLCSRIVLSRSESGLAARLTGFSMENAWTHPLARIFNRSRLLFTNMAIAPSNLVHPSDTLGKRSKAGQGTSSSFGFFQPANLDIRVISHITYTHIPLLLLLPPPPPKNWPSSHHYPMGILIVTHLLNAILS
jgi:hypothetical protein